MITDDDRKCESGTTKDPWAQKYAFECWNCGKKFNEQKVHSQHTRTCEERELECKPCRSKFLTVQVLNKHMDAHHGSFKWKCANCTERFVFKEELVKHFIAVHDERPYKCPICDKTFEAEENMKLHVTTHEKGGQPCTVCGKVSQWQKVHCICT